MDSWESEERITISCPKVEHLGLMLSGVRGGGSFEVSTRSMIVVSLVLVSCSESSVVGVIEMLAMAFFHFEFLHCGIRLGFAGVS